MKRCYYVYIKFDEPEDTDYGYSIVAHTAKQAKSLIGQQLLKERGLENMWTSLRTIWLKNAILHNEPVGYTFDSLEPLIALERHCINAILPGEEVCPHCGSSDHTIYEVYPSEIGCDNCSLSIIKDHILLPLPEEISKPSDIKEDKEQYLFIKSLIDNPPSIDDQLKYIKLYRTINLKIDYHNILWLDSPYENGRKKANGLQPLDEFCPNAKTYKVVKKYIEERKNK